MNFTAISFNLTEKKKKKKKKKKNSHTKTVLRHEKEPDITLVNFSAIEDKNKKVKQESQRG